MATRVSSPTFVGRREELDRVAAALRRALDGQPAVLLVAGEAGVGKTRLVREVATTASDSGMRVLTGGCIPLGAEGLPFGAVIEVLRGVTRGLAPDEVDGLVGSGRGDLVRLMPDLAKAGTRPPADADVDGTARGSLFEYVLLLLERLAARTPLLLVFEDVHWADRSTLELLTFLTRNLRKGPIALLATYRNDELHSRHPLAPFLAELARDGRAERLELRRFDRTEVASQLEGILGREPEADEVRRVLARSQGNAFYTEELVASGTAADRLPATLGQVLLARVATLSEPTHELLRVASAAGPRISAPLLASASGVGGAALTRALREAVAHQILVPDDRESGDRYAFRHALVQEAVYGDLLPGERLNLHAAYARALDEGGAAVPTRSAELAFHWQAAQDLPRAFAAWIEAGLAAESLYAFPEAGAHFERALELWDAVGDAVVAAPLDRVDLHLRAAAYLEVAGSSGSLEHVRAALSLVDPIAEPLRAGLLHERLGAFLANAHPGPEALDAYREAVRLIPTDPPSVARARVLLGLGEGLADLHRWTDAAPLFADALAIARSVGATAEEGRALTSIAVNQVRLGDVDAGNATMRQAVDLADEVGDVHAASRARLSQLWLLNLSGRSEDAVAASFDALAFLDRHGLASRFGSGALASGAEALMWLGRWNEAADALRQAADYDGFQDPDVANLSILLDALSGRYEAADRRVRRLQLPLGDPFGSFNVIPAVSELALWRGDPLGARIAVRQGIADFEGLRQNGARVEYRIRRDSWLNALGIRAEADLAAQARASGSDPAVTEARETATGLMERMSAGRADTLARRPYYTQPVEAWYALCEAEFSRLEALPDPDRWARVAVQWAALAIPYFEAYALMREGEAALARSHDRGRAAIALTAARAIALRLGAEPLRRETERLAGRGLGQRSSDAGATTPPAAAPRPALTAAPRQRDRDRDGLTPRERDVLVLLAAGQSDGQIAEALFITKKTASSHVAHIKDKLGARSRVEIATSAIGLGLVDVPVAESR